jgi:hypothetical protein
MTELPREVNLIIGEFPKEWVSAGIARALLVKAFLSPYDNGSPSEFAHIKLSFIGMETNAACTACITLTFRNDLDDDTLHNHLNCYMNGWALPVNLVHDGSTHHFFATLWEMHPSTKFTKDVLLERMKDYNDSQCPYEKELSAARQQVIVLGLSLEEKDNEIFLLQEEIKKRNEFVSAIRTRLSEKVSEAFLARKELKKKDDEIAKLLTNR